MLLQGLASLVAKTNRSLPVASIIASGAAATGRPSRATSGPIFQGVCIRVVMPLINMAIVVADGEWQFIPTPNDSR